MDALIKAFQADTAAAFASLATALEHFTTGVAHEVANAKPRAIAADPGDEKLSPDEALYDSAPTLTVPKHAKFAPLLEVGHRFLAAAKGMWIEVRRPWLHALQPIHKQLENGPRIPYGTLEPKIELSFGRLSAALPLIKRFAEEATKAAPSEHAAWIVWDAQAKQLAYKPVEVLKSSADHIHFNRPALLDHESLAIDLHSHGGGEAFFSPIDDKDDAGEVKISGVLGGLRQNGKPSAVFRLNLLGLLIPLAVPVAAIFAVEEPA